MLRLTTFLFFLLPAILFAQPKAAKLTVEKIMRDSKWIGSSPANPFWDADGDKLYFDWNPEQAPSDSLYFISIKNKIPQKASVEQKQEVVNSNSIQYNQKRSAYVYSKEGDIFYKEIKSGKTHRVTKTVNNEFNPVFSFNDKKIVYTSNQNLYGWDIASGETIQLTNFLTGTDKKEKEKLSDEEKWLKNDQLQYLKVLKERKDKKRQSEIYDSSLPKNELKKIYIDDKKNQGLSISSDGRFISYRLYKPVAKRKLTIVPEYVTESGYTTDITGREKVGEEQGSSQLFILDSKTDSLYEVKTDSLSGIKDIPDYIKDYPKEYEKLTKLNAVRPVIYTNASWSPSGNNLVLDIRSQDHKDRWLALWNRDKNNLKLLDHQRDEAWIGGPGMRNEGWIDENNFWYQSEVTGYSHLYSVNITDGKKKTYTSGKFEVQDAQLSNDKKYFYITTNEVNPGEQQYYRLSIAGSKLERITTLTGANQVTISPDEKTIAILYSYSNKPWELYLQENKPTGKPEQITRNNHICRTRWSHGLWSVI